MSHSELLRRTCELNTRLLLNALDRVDDEAAVTRPGPRANHVAFLACHLVETRHLLARMLGPAIENPFEALLRDARRLDDVEGFPPLAEIRSAWRAVSSPLAQRLGTAGPAALEAAAPHDFPIEGGDRVGGAAAFLLGHEAYHIGQIGLLRRIQNLPPMSWR